MRNDQHLAIDLRRRGRSYNDIATQLGIPKSTLSGWLRTRSWSQEIRRKLDQKQRQHSIKRMRALARVQKEKWEQWREEYRREARERFTSLVRDPLFIAGIMLYWGEGDNKSRSSVRLANTDPRMIKLFFRFLQHCCRLPPERIYIDLLLYPDLSPLPTRRFWSTYLGIAEEQFSKPQIIRSKNFHGLHPSKRLQYGVCTIRVNSGGLKEQMRVWQDMCYRTVGTF